MRAVSPMSRVCRVGRMRVMRRMAVVTMGRMGPVRRVRPVGRMGPVRSKSFLSKQQAENDDHAAYCQYFAARNISLLIKKEVLNRMLHMREQFF